MKILLPLLALFTSHPAFATAFTCKEIREEPGTPTVGFDLSNVGDVYTASFLYYPADENKAPEVSLVIKGLSCTVPVEDNLLFTCSRLGASIEGVKVQETSHLGGKPHSRTYYEFRAVGVDVPGTAQTYRSNFPRSCQLHP